MAKGMTFFKCSSGKTLWGTAMVFSLLMLALLYRVPAYFLGYNSDPPLGFQLSKYILAMFLGICSLPLWFYQFRSLKIFDFIYVATFVVLAWQGYRIASWDLVEAGFWPLIAFIVIRFVQPVPPNLLSQILAYSFVAYGLFVLAQVSMLVFYGYGFMHSTDSIITSRFGGFVVDPLAAPMLCFLFLGWSMGLRKPVFYTALIALFVAMTHTWTAYVFLIVAMGFCGSYLLWNKFCRFWSLLFGGVWIAGVFAAAVKINDMANMYPFLAGKLVSVRLHSTYWWPDQWLFYPSDTFKYSETVWVESIENLGIVWTIFFFGIIFHMAYKAFLSWKDETNPQANAIKLATLIVTGYFLFGSLNLPYPSIFPANLIFYLFVCLVYFDKIRPVPMAKST